MNIYSEEVVRRCSVKKVFLEISQNSQENTCARVFFLIKLRASPCSFIKKETLAQVLSCEFFEISKNTFCHRTPPVAASESLYSLFLRNPFIRKSVLKLPKFQRFVVLQFIFIRNYK